MERSGAPSHQTVGGKHDGDIGSELVSTRQQRIAQLAKQMPEKGLTSLDQHLDLAWLREAYRRTRKDGAAGVDGQTAEDYEENLEGNLRSLLERAKSGMYRAPPVRRVHIPKGTGGEPDPSASRRWKTKCFSGRS